MPRRSSITDENQLAKSIVDELTADEMEEEAKPEKNPAAVALGRLGGMKGGKARAAKLKPAQRKEIARKAANARWSKEQS